MRPEAALLIALLAVGALGGLFVVARSVESAPPDFSVATTENETFVLSAHRGEVVVVDFFATWCAPCQIVEDSIQEGLPAWNASAVAVISIGIDDSETIEDLRSYRAAHNLTWTVARDTDAVARRYSVFAIPHLAVIDGGGNLVYEHQGTITPEELRSVVAETLAGDRSPIGFVQYGLVGLAIVAGAAAFFSPCAVGLLPGYVAHAVGVSGTEGTHRLGRTLAIGILAALGVLVVFFGIGGLALLAGPALTRYVPFLQPLVGFLLIAFGVLLLARPFSLVLQRWTAPLTRWAGEAQAGGFSARSFFAYGIGYGAAAAGCTTPVLLSVLVTAAAYGPLVGSGIVIAYASTAAFLMVVVTLAAATFRGSLGTRLARSSRAIETVSALLFIAGGIFLLWYAARAGTFAV